MKFCIRQGTFETNSSSQHTIVISTNNHCHEIRTGVMKLPDRSYVKYKKVFGDEQNSEFHIDSNGIYDCNIDAHPDSLCPDFSFDWGFKIYPFPMAKAIYALSSFNGEHYVEIIEALQEVYPNLKEIRPCLDDGDDLACFFPPINHQSEFMLTGFFKDNPDVSLREFILNDKYILIIDNDNECYFQQLWDAGIFDRESKVYSIGGWRLLQEDGIWEDEWYLEERKNNEPAE